MSNAYFWLLTLGHFLVDFYGNFLPALLPLMVKRLDISLTMAGLVITATSLAANLLQVPAGFVFDRHPTRAWLPGAVIVSGLFICLAGIMPNYALFLLFPVLSGLGIGLYHPASSSYAYSLSVKNRGFMVSIFASFGSLGFALGPMVAGFFLHYGETTALLWLAIPGLILAAALATVDFNRFIPRRQPGPSNGPSAPLKVSSGFLVLAAVMTLRAWGLMAIANYLPFLLETRGYSYTLAETLLTVFLVVGAVGGIGGAWLSDKIGRKSVIFSTLLVAALGGGVFMVTDGSWSLVMLTICGLTVQMGQPIMVVLSQELMPDNVALASGVSMGLVWGIGALGVALNGWVADQYGINWCFGLAILVILTAAALTLVTPGYKEAITAEKATL
ncbi:MAG: MFS transporter [Methylocystaceae bacterium]